MSETRFTRGTWQQEDECVYVLNADGVNRAFIRVEGGWQAQGVRTTAAERRANAALIAAAPELYEALCKARAQFRRHEAPNLCAQIDAALAKASPVTPSQAAEDKQP